MRKLISILLCAALLACVLGGCGSRSDSDYGDTLHIVTTIFPIYDWVSEIIGEDQEGVELTMLLDNGITHLYRPGPGI